MSQGDKASKEIATKLREARKLITECEQIADRHGLEFNFDTAYGMGGTYYGEGHPDSENLKKQYYKENGWIASSQTC